MLNMFKKNENKAEVKDQVQQETQQNTQLVDQNVDYQQNNLYKVGQQSLLDDIDDDVSGYQPVQSQQPVTATQTMQPAVPVAAPTAATTATTTVPAQSFLQQPQATSSQELPASQPGQDMVAIKQTDPEQQNQQADSKTGKKLSLKKQLFTKSLFEKKQKVEAQPTAAVLQSTSDIYLPDEKNMLTKERVKLPTKRYRYKIINNYGKKESGTFEAETENDVRNFLISQEYQVLEIKERSKSDIDIGGNGKIKAGELSFSLTQLSTYIKSGITLADSVRILAKQTKKRKLKSSYNQLIYQLIKGENLSSAMEMQEPFYPKLLINMVKTAEMTGDLPSILDDMAEYYTSMDQTRKQMKSAMIYPAVVLTIAFGVLVFMLTYLVPQFTSLFEEQGASLPLLTQTIVGISNFMKKNWLILLGQAVGSIVLFYFLYTKVKKFKEIVQTILMHVPVIKSVIIYNEVANFTKTFASLLNHGVFITDSMAILSKITSNEVYKKIINRTLENLGKGESISSAFKGEWAFPVVAYEMIVTGETTGQLGNMMEKVASHFQMLHKNVIDQLKSLIEPILICFLAVVVGIILVSIIQPMFSIYSQIK